MEIEEVIRQGQDCGEVQKANEGVLLIEPLAQIGEHQDESQEERDGIEIPIDAKQGRAHDAVQPLCEVDRQHPDVGAVGPEVTPAPGVRWQLVVEDRLVELGCAGSAPSW